MKYRGEAEFSRHQQLVHADIDKTFTDEEFNSLNEKEREEVENNPETPRQKFIKKNSRREEEGGGWKEEEVGRISFW